MSSKNSFFNIDGIELQRCIAKKLNIKKKLNDEEIRTCYLLDFLQVKDKDEKLGVSQTTVASKK